MISITMIGSEVRLHMSSEGAKNLYNYLHCSELLKLKDGEPAYSFSKSANDAAWAVENALGDLIRGGQ